MTDVVQSGDLGDGAARNIGRVVIRALRGLCADSRRLIPNWP
jgi:hypothetical protein